MPKKKQTEEIKEPATNPPEDNKTEPQPFMKREQESVSVKFNLDGRPDFPSMRAATKEKLKRLVLDPDLKKELGLEGSEAVPQVVDDQFAGAIIDALGMLEAQLVQFPFLGSIPAEIARKVFIYTPQEKMILAPLTATVLNKHLPSGVSQWQEEIQLAVVLLAITHTKFKIAKEMARQPQRVNGQAEPEQPATVAQ